MGLSYWIVPHTHWDREWYLSFQDFRWKLVGSVDAIVDTLRSDSDFGHFMLDGQTILLEDYLELRPGRRQELSDLIRAGRIAVGPWYVQPDDILTTGEALIRNLESGIRIGSAMGGVMSVGYLPDSFGHCSALPAILQGFGIGSACLMRGVGPEIDKSLFTWRSRDGSRVLVAYLVDSYGNGADLAMEPKAFCEGLSILAERQKDAALPGVPILVMNGMDHRSITPRLPEMIKESGLIDRAHIGSLADYLDIAARGISTIPEWAGELRSTWSFPITVGCTSTRHWIKQEDQAISALLEREVEPLAAMASWLGDSYPTDAIAVAWKHLLQNQPHDSICGCSIDRVHEDMRYRYAQARDLGANIASGAAAVISSRVDSSYAGKGETVAVAVNPGPSRRGTLLTFSAAEIPPDPILVDRERRVHVGQLVSQEGTSAVFFDEHFTSRQTKLAIGMVKDGRLMEFAVQKACASWESPSQLRIDLELAETAYSSFDWQKWVKETSPLLETPGLARVHAVGIRCGSKRVIFISDLPAFAARTFHLESRRSDNTTPGPGEGSDLRIGRRFLENRFYRIRLLPDGSLDVVDRRLGVRLRGVNRFVDGGDRGDEYNYDSPTHDQLVAAPSRSAPLLRRLKTDVAESGPVRATLRVRALYRIPASVSLDRSRRTARKVNVEVVGYVSLLSEVQRIELRTEIDNKARDHRMRVHFPLAGRSDSSLAGATFEAIRRPLAPEKAPPGRQRPEHPDLGEERPPCTHPFNGFVASGAEGATIAVFARGLREYELLDRGDRSEIAITLFRAVGWLSRGDLVSRRGNAGPDAPTPGAQVIGARAFEYALQIYGGEPDESLLCRDWEDYRVAPRVVVQTSSVGDLGDCESLVEIADEKMIFSSLRRTPAGDLALRAVDVGGNARFVTVRFSRPVSWARRTRLDGTLVSDLSVVREGQGSSLQVSVAPWEIATIEFGGNA